MTNPPTKPDISEELRAIHNRFHGRYDTHKEVAKHSNWTAQELENVQIGDELLMYDEIQTLIATKVNEAKVDALKKLKQDYLDHLLTAPAEEVMKSFDFIDQQVSELTKKGKADVV